MIDFSFSNQNWKSRLKKPNRLLKRRFNINKFKNCVCNIYITESILNNYTKCIFIDLFNQLNENALVKNKRLYFKSLALISSFTKYDCDLTLYFIRNNVHFNLKSELEISAYFDECSSKLIKIKNTDYLASQREIMFGNYFLYSIWFILLIVLLFGAKIFFSKKILR